MSPISIPSIRLNDGNDLPAVGFGTYKLNGSAGVSDIVSAIKVGYRLLDSAFNYENEGAVGEAVREAGIARDKLRIVSKLPGRHHHFEEAIATVEESLYRAQLDYYDLYLIHWPNPSKDLYVEAWQALIEARKKGLIRSIGVCNFLPEHLERLIKETGVTPVVNQVELHPYFPQEEQRAWDKAHGIVTESWSPLGRASKLLQDDTIKKIADRLGKSIPQIILRWHVQLGAIPIPKASSKERQIENLSLFDFELSPQDVEIIATLARPDGRLADQDPARYEEF
ncbi:2,5-diketo-D-gluconic acid reductase B [Zymomonas mobilis subsp. mobilis str. CP4 = NRRL B-14023]|nr:aldo/keto reductase, diketogulonate reductase [Zymomonas mobilis subsp. mobilis str. CP4 = NRRL B-14023]AHJ69657.1 2,5-diketo-D-gluconic acid reductase B [Zymomonas mobilis subsp. mobilis NRRL B-12526]AHJ71513.1 2,5-diketo-D-gluconic acid reductase B [Zymomonas mobilis subsp. mobilis str. CP4 = NRRL B-14023]TWE24706.1 diketogulonate reductase-like aldo/keto reductase [Zymomonas mobilis]